MFAAAGPAQGIGVAGVGSPPSWLFRRNALAATRTASQQPRAPPRAGLQQTRVKVELRAPEELLEHLHARGAEQQRPAQIAILLAVRVEIRRREQALAPVAPQHHVARAHHQVRRRAGVDRVRVLQRGASRRQSARARAHACARAHARTDAHSRTTPFVPTSTAQHSVPEHTSWPQSRHNAGCGGSLWHTKHGVCVNRRNSCSWYCSGSFTMGRRPYGTRTALALLHAHVRSVSAHRSARSPTRPPANVHVIGQLRS